MAEEVRIWKILKGDQLKEIERNKLNLEERIQRWLEKDISILSEDLLVIGKEVKTDYGGYIDLLCIDNNGDLVIVELKRDKTPREITAQALDYASWVETLNHEKVNEIAKSYLGNDSPLENAFKDKFKVDLPEVLNESHKMMIVASQIDDSSERIIRYLSDKYGVGINAATFKYFKDGDENEYLAKIFLIEPGSTTPQPGGKRLPNLTYEELENLADRNGVLELYRKLDAGLRNIFDSRKTTRSTLAFIGDLDGSRSVIMSLVPGESRSERISGGTDSEHGLRFQVYIDRLTKYLDKNRDEVLAIMPEGFEDFQPFEGAEKAIRGFFKSIAEIDQFLTKLQVLKK
jgi:hypothetical protein